jgi:hypothetical protein
MINTALCYPNSVKIIRGVQSRAHPGAVKGGMTPLGSYPKHSFRTTPQSEISHSEQTLIGDHGCVSHIGPIIREASGLGIRIRSSSPISDRERTVSRPFLRHGPNF